MNNATLPFTLALADKGWRKAVQDDPHLANGVNVVQRKVTSEAVARSLKMAYTPLKQAPGLSGRTGRFPAEPCRRGFASPLMRLREQC